MQNVHHHDPAPLDEENNPGDHEEQDQNENPEIEEEDDEREAPILRHDAKSAREQFVRAYYRSFSSSRSSSHAPPTVSSRASSSGSGDEFRFTSPPPSSGLPAANVVIRNDATILEHPDLTIPSGAGSVVREQ